MCARRLIDPLDGPLARARETAPAANSRWALPRTLAEWQTWRPRLLTRLQEALAPWPDRVPLGAEELEEHDAGAHRRLKVLYDSEAFSTVPAWTTWRVARRWTPSASAASASPSAER
jgi:hypothetical protein